MGTFTSGLKRHGVTLGDFGRIFDWWKRHGFDLGCVPRRGWRLFRVLPAGESGTTQTLWLNDGQLERCFDEPYSFHKELTRTPERLP